MKKLKKTKNDRPTDKELEALWSKCIHARDGEVCVYTKELYPRRPLIRENLNAHHILKKGTLRLRTDLDNGILISWGVHNNVAHGPGCRPKQFEQWALDRLPKARRDKLLMFQNAVGGVDRFALKLYLQQKLKEFTDERNRQLVQ